MTREFDPLAVTITEAQVLLGLSRTTIYSLISKRQVGSVKIGKRRLIIFASLKAFLEQGDMK